MSDIIIYTDGGCHGNPGPGGWGIVVIQGDDLKSLSGGEKLTTNNRMELTAAINALECVTKNPFHVGKKNRSEHRQPVRQKRNNFMDNQLEEKRLENCGRKTCKKSGTLGNLGCLVPKTFFGRLQIGLDMGQRTRRNKIQ